MSPGENVLVRLRPVDRADDPRVGPFRLMRDGDLRGLGAMILDSEKVVLRALKAGHRVRKVLASREYYEKHAALLDVHGDAELFCGSKPLMQEIIGHRIHQGMMAVADRPENAALSELGPKVCVLDGLVDASNVGAIVRGCHAFGIDSILVGEGSPSPYVRRAIRVSMGSVFKMRVRQSRSLVRELEWLKWKGHAVIGAGVWDDAVPVRDMAFPERSVLVIGNEDKGIRPEIKALCDRTVFIPVAPGIDSLNAACAASVLLYEMGSGL